MLVYLPIKHCLPYLERLYLTLGGYFLALTMVDTFDAAPKLSEVSIAGNPHVARFFYHIHSLQNSRPIHLSFQIQHQFLSCQPSPAYIFTIINYIVKIGLILQYYLFLRKPLLLSTMQILSSIISWSGNPCLLKSLHILNTDQNLPGDLPALLTLTLALETLETDACWPADVNALTSLDPGSILVPNLTKCTLIIQFTDHPSEMSDTISLIPMSAP